jgi:hypothetical protein
MRQKHPAHRGRFIAAVLASLLATATYATQSVPTTDTARGPASSIDKVLVCCHSRK